MILSTGIDIVKVSRFAHWHIKSKTQLKKIFSDIEINYCLKNLKKSSERFAVRFAIKEAFYKAYSHMGIMYNISFIKLCKSIEIEKNQFGVPILKVDYQQLALQRNIKFHISLSHEQEYATCILIIEKL